MKKVETANQTLPKSPNNPRTFIFYKPPLATLNSFQNYRKSSENSKSNKSSHASPIKPNNKPEKSTSTHRKNAQSMDSTPIYIVNNKKNYVIYNDIKVNHSFSISPPFVFPLNDSKIKDLKTKKSLNDHYQQIFQQIKTNNKTPSRAFPLQTPCFKTTSTQESNSMTFKPNSLIKTDLNETIKNIGNFKQPQVKYNNNNDVTINNDESYNKKQSFNKAFISTKNNENPKIETIKQAKIVVKSNKEDTNTCDNVEKDTILLESAIKKYLSEPNPENVENINNNALKEMETLKEIEKHNDEPQDRKEKVKKGKKIETSEVGYSTGDESIITIAVKDSNERKEMNKKTNKIEKKTWKEDEDKKLVEAYEKFIALQSKKINKWDFIASQFGGRNPSQCKQRYKRLIKPPPARKKWGDLEDKLLKEAVEVDKLASWEIIADRMKTKGFVRTGKQVRERYINHLDPTINLQPFKPEEDVLIMTYYRVHGNKWAKIAKYLINRSENAVKNRFHYHIKKHLATGDKPAIEPKKDEGKSDINKMETESIEEELPELDDYKLLDICKDISEELMTELDENKCMKIFGDLNNLKFNRNVSGSLKGQESITSINEENNMNLLAKKISREAEKDLKNVD